MVRVTKERWKAFEGKVSMDLNTHDMAHVKSG